MNLRRKLALRSIFLAAFVYSVFAATAEEGLAIWGSDRNHTLGIPQSIQGKVAAVSAGSSHVAVVLKDGSTRAWPAYDPEAELEIPPEGQTGSVAVSAGYGHTLILKADGGVVAFGDNSQGQTTVPEEAKSRVVAISAGYSHSLALTSSGKVIAWGRMNGNAITLPEEMLSGVQSINAGCGVFAITTNGRVVASRSQDILAIPTDERYAESISCGGATILALRHNRSVAAWGDNSFGQSTVPLEAHKDVIAIAASYKCSLALKADGRLIAWGTNDMNQLDVPERIAGKVRAISTGGGFTVAIAEATPPAIQEEPSTPAAILGQPLALHAKVAGFPLQIQWRKDGEPLPGATGECLSLGPARIDHAGVYDMVASSFMGSVTSAPVNLSSFTQPVPGAPAMWGPTNKEFLSLRISERTNIMEFVERGGNFALLDSGGGVFAWSGNIVDQTNVPAAAKSGVVSLKAGSGHFLALKDDGGVVAWGSNGYGQSTVPAEAASGVAVVAAAGSRSYAITKDGILLNWGENVFIPNAARSNMITVAGQSQMAGLKRDGSIVLWNPTGFVPAAASSGVIDVAASGGTFLALKYDGSVVAWGRNENGETNVPPSASKNVKAISMGYDTVNGGTFCAALKQDGSVVVWGADSGWARTPMPEAQGKFIKLGEGSTRLLGIMSSTPPQIVANPVAKTVEEGEIAFLSVVADGFPLSFQWQKDGVNIAGATGQTLTLGRALRSISGSYTVVITNFLGSATSSPVDLKINPTTPGSAFTWGKYGLGFGLQPIPLEAQSDVIAVAAGGGAAFALKSNGKIVAWGSNTRKELDVPPEAANGVSSIAQHGYGAVLTNGAVIIWGQASPSLTNVPVTAKSGVSAVSVGHGTAAALKQDGSVVVWGNIKQVPATVKTGVVKVEIGNDFVAALKLDGSVVEWRNSDFPQPTTSAAARSGVVDVYATASGSAVLKADGSVIVWDEYSPKLTRVPDEALSEVKEIATSSQSVLALKRDGRLIAWGDDSFGLSPFPRGTSTLPVVEYGLHAFSLGGDGIAIAKTQSPEILVTPVGKQVEVGLRTYLTVRASGYPLHYQWYKNGEIIPEGTGPTYNLRPVRQLDEAAYTVVVSNSLGSVTSSPPTLLKISPRAPIEGAVVAWGSNDQGQTSIPEAAKAGVIAVAAAENHSLALTSEGRVLAWGDGFYGQTNIPAAAQQDVVAIASKGKNQFALKSDGTLVAWGHDAQNREASVPKIAQSGVADIVAGDGFAIALKADGTVVGWGQSLALDYSFFGNDQLLEQSPAGFTAVAGAKDELWAVDSNGQAINWRRGDIIWTNTPSGAERGVKAIKMAGGFKAALKEDGRVVLWGTNVFRGATAPEQGLRADVASLAGSPNHALALKSDGTILAWGREDEGQTDVPEEVQGGAVAVAAGGMHSLALVTPQAPTIARQPVSQSIQAGRTSHLSVAARGYPMSYQWKKDGLDIPGATNALYNFPPATPAMSGAFTIVLSNSLGVITGAPPAIVTVEKGLPQAGHVVEWRDRGVTNANLPPALREGVVAVSASQYNSLALKADGSVIAWGLVRGLEALTNVPQSASHGVVAVSAGYDQSLALKSDGSVLVWGNRPRDPADVPQPELANVVAISAGGGQNLALTRNGQVLAWGRNEFGQSIVPERARKNVIAISAGNSHSLALRSDGSVIAWGNLYYVGAVPQLAKEGVVEIAAGGSINLALKQAGGAIGWNPERTWSIENVKAIAAGYRISVVVQLDGSVRIYEMQYPIPDAVRSNVFAVAAGYDRAIALVGQDAPTVATLSFNVVQSGGVLSWPSQLKGFKLQSTKDLTPPAIWLDDTNQPVLEGQSFRMTNETASETLFYRLLKP